MKDTECIIFNNWYKKPAIFLESSFPFYIYIHINEKYKINRVVEQNLHHINSKRTLFQGGGEGIEYSCLGGNWCWNSSCNRFIGKTKKEKINSYFRASRIAAGKPAK
ncbi:hypothetical protein [Neobacillus sp. LXY-1]|uniref:hypothetical protein n=1 Tax=Neobacillus sp. LXY-1 TaxID=3379133 RepID=UPI003EDF9BCF